MPTDDAHPLVHQMAREYEARCSLSFEELLDAGVSGLRKAEEKFDPSGETGFDEYAVWWIRQRITKAIVDAA